MTSDPSAGVERAPDTWSDAPVGNSLALVVLAATAVYLVIVPEVALFLGALLAGIVAVTVLPVAVATVLAVGALRLRIALLGADGELDDRYAV